MQDNLSFKNIFRRETKLASYIIICLTVVVLSLSYAMFFKVDGNSKNQVVKAGDLVFTYENSSQTISNEKSDCFLPMTTDETSLYLGTCDYRLSVQNTGSLKGAYTLKLIANPENTIEANKLKVVVRKQVGDVLEVVSGYENGKVVSELTNGILIEDDALESNTTTVYSISLIVDESLATEADTSKVLSYKIEGTGLVHESQSIHTDPTAAETILAKGETDELKYDNTTDNNLRYVGLNPNNYVSFNNELWRIIGVFNNIDDGTGKKETRLKIIRSEPIGNYVWDNKASGTGSSTSAAGSNDWSDSALQVVLNEGAYWNRTSGECPYEPNGATTSCDFTSTGLTEEAKSMIGNAKWNLGGSSTYNDVTARMFYERERGTTVYSGRPTEWIGKIGLMYPSDYGYATSGGSTTNRETCLNTELFNWYGSSVSDCFNNDWLYNNFNSQWTITPESSESIDVFEVRSHGNGSVGGGLAYERNAVSPALYLSSNVKITGGDGTKENPYTLSL